MRSAEAFATRRVIIDHARKRVRLPLQREIGCVTMLLACVGGVVAWRTLHTPRAAVGLFLLASAIPALVLTLQGWLNATTFDFEGDVFRCSVGPVFERDIASLPLVRVRCFEPDHAGPGLPRVVAVGADGARLPLDAEGSCLDAAALSDVLNEMLAEARAHEGYRG
jgi:hypothetical protein